MPGKPINMWQKHDSHRQLKRAMHRAVRIKPKLQWRIQIRDAMNVEHVLRKAMIIEAIQRVVMWPTNGKVKGVGLPKPSGNPDITCPKC